MVNTPSILFIHNTYLQKGGEDTVVQQEIEFLKNRGWQVHTLFFSNQKISRGWLKWMAPLWLFFNPRAFIKVYLQIKKHKITLVHVHNFYYEASPAVFRAAKAAGARTVFTVHNYRLFCLNGFFFYNNETCFDCHQQKSFRRGIERKCFQSSALSSRALAMATDFHRHTGTWKKYVDQFLVLNPLQKQMLTETGISAEKIMMKPNFLHETEAPASYNQREDFLLFAGRMSPEKGIVALINALKGKKIPLLLVGNGPLAAWVNTQTDEWIRYRPKVEKNTLQELYRKCAALVFPSIWPEGQPLTVIEAQQAGAIVIAARSANLEKMIHHEETGLLYEAKENDALWKAISQLNGYDLVTKNKLSANAYRYFKAQYTEETHYQILEKAYQVNTTT